MKTLAPNTLLQNRYLVVQLIGKGGMGEVYLAVDQRLGSAVALKRTFFSDDEMLGNAFEREAKTLARLRHPVLPKVSDHFVENDTQYLAMEHISGDDLSKRLELSDKPFPLSWVLFWSDQLLDALAYLHSHEPPIVHRDIKPQNLKLTDENHIVLLDFGLAKNSIGNTRVTSTGGSIVGYTPHYAPMEQIRGTGTNPRSDLYSLSATVYQLLTNTVPPDALTRADSVLNSMPDPTKPLNVLNPEIPKVISDVILKGMSLSMDQRYTDAREMQKALREAYAGIQSSMAAQTLAFNKAEIESQLPQSQQKTEHYAGVSHITEQPQRSHQPKTENFPVPMQSDAFSPKATFEPSDDFNGGMKDNGQDFGFKTEVLPADKMPRPENYNSPATGNYVSPSEPKNDFKTDDFSFEPEDDFSDEKPFDPNVTSPLINFDKDDLPGGRTENFDSSNRDEKTFIPIALPRETSDSARNFADVERSEPEREDFAPAVAVQTPTPKKSNGKALAVVGLLIAFAVLSVGAAAIGWYVMQPSEPTTVTTTPSPTVEATIAPSPTVEPTMEANTNTSVDTNTNTETTLANSSNTNTSDVTSNPTTPTETTVTDQTGKKETVASGGKRQQPERQVKNTTGQNPPKVNSTAANVSKQSPPPIKVQPTKPKSDPGGIYQ